MPGLPFPSNPVFARENSEFDHGASTPLSNVDDVPIDPALSEPPIDPAILVEGKDGVVERQRRVASRNVTINNAFAWVSSMQPQEPLPKSSPEVSKRMPAPVHQYSLGPQGDPFAPPPPAYFIPEEQPAPSSKPLKRKRKPRREPECGFCQGDGSKNKNGEPERMVSCDECGRSGHPTCMQLADISETIFSYPWKCMECKNCEICQEKGDDNRILFCDFCDRGWHMDCLDPPLDEEPPGKWHCPLCPPLPPDSTQDVAMGEIPDYRESSIASTSHSGPDRKGKGKAVERATQESDVEVEVDGEGGVKVPKGRKRSSRKIKARPRADADIYAEPSSVRSTSKRMRIKIPTSPVRTPTQRKMVVRLKLPTRDKGKEKEDSDPESPKGLFDEVLRPEERDTSRTSIEAGDKIRFDRSRTWSEAKLNPLPLSASEDPQTPVAGPSSRPLRSAMQYRSMAISIPSPGPSASPAPSTPAPDSAKIDSSSRPLRIRTIRFGEYDIQTWYDAPFPEEYANIPDGRLWICEFCLKYMRSRFQAVRHATKCKARHPPGDEIYRDGFVSIFEIYCQNLCLLSKMFLDHKSLFYDVEPFLFYVITEVDELGARFVGYFSKEKHSPKDYNVSCIMTLPVRQRKGWGNLLIDFSYLLSKKERRAGSPEKPLSSLGALSYKNYWTLAVMQYLNIAPHDPKLEDISSATSMTVEDIYNTLVQQNMITAKEHTPSSRPAPGQSIKFPRGRKNGVARRHLQRPQTQDEEKPRGPFTPPRDYTIHWDPEEVQQYLMNWESKGYLRLKPEKLKWSPFLMTRARRSQILGSGMGTKTEMAPLVDPLTAKSQPPDVDLDVSVFGEGPSTPRRGRHNDLQRDLARTDSPAAALFDADEEVIDARSGMVTPSNPSLAAQASSSPVPSDDEDSLNRGVRTLALSNTRSIRTRSNRSQSLRNTVSVSPTLSRTRSAPAKIAKVRKDLDEQPNTLNDEALAAQLAREGFRQLRSRSAAVVPLLAENDRKRGTPTTTPRAISPRKRRRVESSPEFDLLLPSTPLNGQSSSSRLLAPRPRTATHSSRLLAGNDTIAEEDTTALQILASAANGAGAEQHLNGDVKAEDISTPSTAVASRHSVPSEDTTVESDSLVKVKVVQQDVVMADGTTSDMDAEGEEDADEDAEGEPDDEAL
ncbi:hypothetical protein NEOLEDRAFT_1174884 [Neolentinus lepideus HHB14362 ss-1]|uniref:Histone acetyltransferase n=1 Tax=Neolentinus lepideus HHB14362 ss-1 TaxID=1314782 RepID=A0A165VMR2_9AGAM|nr:hypothetical protein NEOLEDRAFT_1174884 [Neolentinus lepideus HHB14362 ss-1]